LQVLADHTLRTVARKTCERRRRIIGRRATDSHAEGASHETLRVTLANGSAGSGYIYADNAYSHLTFQVIGSRLKPGRAEEKIVATAMKLMRDVGE
jgi:hypothetical protein